MKIEERASLPIGDGGPAARLQHVQARRRKRLMQEIARIFLQKLLRFSVEVGLRPGAAVRREIDIALRAQVLSVYVCSGFRHFGLLHSIQDVYSGACLVTAWHSLGGEHTINHRRAGNHAPLQLDQGFPNAWISCSRSLGNSRPMVPMRKVSTWVNLPG